MTEEDATRTTPDNDNEIIFVTTHNSNSRIVIVVLLCKQDGSFREFRDHTFSTLETDKNVSFDL